MAVEVGADGMQNLEWAGYLPVKSAPWPEYERTEGWKNCVRPKRNTDEYPDSVMLAPFKEFRCVFLGGALTSNPDVFKTNPLNPLFLGLSS